MDLGRSLRAVEPLHQVEGLADAGGHARAGEDVPVIDVSLRRADVDPVLDPRESFRVVSVRGGIRSFGRPAAACTGDPAESGLGRVIARTANAGPVRLGLGEESLLHPV
ncbi:hypothetical protein [Streptomyces sp. NPDC003023]|uniref:hypothetical protein n=1 Tax=Streptomyces sp. NPDC003023 TaxID=3364675 RepID=UPI0036ACBBF8